MKAFEEKKNQTLYKKGIHLEGKIYQFGKCGYIFFGNIVTLEVRIRMWYKMLKMWHKVPLTLMVLVVGSRGLWWRPLTAPDARGAPEESRLWYIVRSIHTSCTFGLRGRC